MQADRGLALRSALDVYKRQEHERQMKMEQLRVVSQREKILFPIAVTTVVVLLLPSAAPLVGMLMLGNLFKECGRKMCIRDRHRRLLPSVSSVVLTARQRFI